MGLIELMAIGNPSPGMNLSMGSAMEILAPMLVVLGVSGFGIVWASRSRLRVPRVGTRTGARVLRASIPAGEQMV